MSEQLRLRLRVLFLVVGLPAHICAQDMTAPALTDQDQVLPEWIEDIDEPVSGSELLESLDAMRSSPLDLNTATPEELEAVPGLDLRLVKAIINRRSKTPFDSISDLDHVPGFSPALRVTLSEFLTVRRSDPLTMTIRSRVIRDLNLERGFRQKQYPGNPFHIYHRVGLSKGPFSAGFVFEKDPGEPRWNDFQTGFCQFQSDQIVRKIIVGALRFESAQGLVFWGPSGFSKSGEVLGVRKKSRGLTPSRSATEFGKLNGLGVTLNIDILEVTALGSISTHDASFKADGTVSAIQKTGLHRTSNEIAKKNRLEETLVGGRVCLTLTENLRVGATVSQSRYDAAFPSDPASGQSGKSHTVWGADYDTRLHNHIFFGEFARTEKGERAFVNGAIFDFDTPAGEFGQALLFRYYDSEFQNMRGSPFGERSGIGQNEWGIYVAARWKPSRGWTFSGYRDWYRFPKRTVSNPPEADGHEVLFQIDRRWSGWFRTQVRFRRESKSDWFTTLDTYGRDSVIAALNSKTQLRLQAEFKPSASVRLKSRVAWVATNNGPFRGSQKTGLSIYEDLRMRPLPGLTIDARITFFGTDGFETALYEVENDVPGAFGIPAFFDRGVRWYVMAKYNILKSLTTSVRYSELTREGVNSIGSGNDEVRGNRIRAFKAQLDLKL